MPLYRNAFYWFIALLGLLLVGFWSSYFSRLLGDVHPTHHFHGIVMLAWMLMLIAQSWLIRTRRNARHRAVGKLSFILAPLIVLSGIMVTFYSQGNLDEADTPFALGIFWFGLFSALMFGLMYTLAIVNRRNMQLHARYMVLTSLVFILPGLSRTVDHYIAPLGVWVPTFYQLTYIPLLISLCLMAWDLRNGKPFKPYLVSTVCWSVSAVAWVALPAWSVWQSFGAWTANRF